ncbi:MAG: AAA family ATPase, partial [Actinobacteria bacterium]|nr:AAA family ATPase [Actinomycetota bacterium]
MTEERFIGPIVQEEDRDFDAALRPRSLREFVGQDRIKEQLALLVEGAVARGETVDHLLFSGPPGLGKTTLAAIVAAEMGVAFRPTSGPALERAGDLAAILTNLEEGDVL